MADRREKKAPEYPVETRQVTYLPAGVGVDPYQGTPTLDPKLAEAREAEIKANDVKIDLAPKEPTIDDALVKAREDEIKRDRERAERTGGARVARTSDAPAPAKKSAPKSDKK